MRRPSRPILRIVDRAQHRLEERSVDVDGHVATALANALASATPAQRLTLLTLLETPKALEATEELISVLVASAK